MNKPAKLYVIDYYVNGKVQQTINADMPKPYPFIVWFIRENKYIYKDGKLVPRCTNAKEVAQWIRQHENKINARIIKTGK